MNETEPNSTQISHAAISNPRLTYGARGILAYMCSLPNDSTVTEESLVAAGPAMLMAVRTYLKELHDAGYIKHERVETVPGRFEWHYSVNKEGAQ